LIVGALVSVGLLMTFSLWGVVAATSTLVGVFVLWLLLRCLVEHLRLQKKIAGCDFDGTITGLAEETIWTCSHCGQMMHSEARCDFCGAQIVIDDV
jgi:hypothetical protein